MREQEVQRPCGWSWLPCQMTPLWPEPKQSNEFAAEVARATSYGTLEAMTVTAIYSKWVGKPP